MQTLLIVEVVLKHGCDLLWSHDGSTHSHWKLTGLDQCKTTGSTLVLNNTVVFIMTQYQFQLKITFSPTYFCSSINYENNPDVWAHFLLTLTTRGFGSTRCNSRLTRTLWIWSLNTCSPEPNLDRFPMRWMEAQRMSSFSWMWAQRSSVSVTRVSESEETASPHRFYTPTNISSEWL